MRIAVSNIAWEATADELFLALLPELGVSAVEVAPTRLWPDWAGAVPAAGEDIRYDLKGRGLECSSLQALLFGRPDLHLFGVPEQREALILHLQRVADLAAALGAGPMVFGSPKNRDRGSLTDAEAFSIATEVFARVGAYCAARGVTLCIEPNPPAYGCNFVTDSAAGIALVRAVGSPGFRLHLDSGGMFMVGDDPVRAVHEGADVLAHFHASEPDLGDFSSPVVDHRSIGAALRAIGWQRWVSIEMRAKPDPRLTVMRAVDVVREAYLS